MFQNTRFIPDSDDTSPGVLTDVDNMVPNLGICWCTLLLSTFLYRLLLLNAAMLLLCKSLMGQPSYSPAHKPSYTRRVRQHGKM